MSNRRLTKKSFTILEVITGIVLTIIIIAAIGWVYVTCIRAWQSTQNLSIARTELTQALELLANDLNQAVVIASLSSTSIKFSTESYQYYYYLSGSDLIRTCTIGSCGSRIIATNIQSGTLFAQSGSLITIDLTSSTNGVSLRMETKVIPSNLVTGLVGWWKFEEASSGTTPTTTVDASSNANSGTLTNSPSWTTGHVDTGALSFNGSNNYVNMGTGVLSNSLNFTITAWVNLDFTGSNANYGILVDDHLVSPWGGISLYVQKSNGAIGRYNPNTLSFIYSSTQTVTANTWTFIAVQTLTDSVNGTIEVSKNGATWETIYAGDTSNIALDVNSPLNIGRWAGGSWYTKGIIDDVRIYNRALSSAEVQALYCRVATCS